MIGYTIVCVDMMTKENLFSCEYTVGSHSGGRFKTVRTVNTEFVAMDFSMSHPHRNTRSTPLCYLTQDGISLADTKNHFALELPDWDVTVIYLRYHYKVLTEHLTGG